MCAPSPTPGHRLLPWLEPELLSAQPQSRKTFRRTQSTTKPLKQQTAFRCGMTWSSCYSQDSSFVSPFHDNDWHAADKHPVGKLIKRMEELLPNLKLPFQGGSLLSRF